MAPQRLLRKGLQGLLALTAILSSCTTDDVLQPQTDLLSATPPPVTNQVTPSQAQEVAKSFSATHFGLNSSLTSRSSQSIETISDTDGTPLAYIVNTDGAGWTIVSATTDYYPILAYSDSSDKTFSLSDIPADHPLNLWLDELTHAIRQSESLDSVTASAIAYEWMDYLPHPAVTAATLPGGNSEKAVACRNRLKQLNDTYYQDGWSFTTLSSAPSDVRPFVNSLADSYNSPYEYTIVGVRKAYTENIYVGPMLTTTWHQVNGYEDMCPYGYPAGCVAVAMGQIMKFYRYPNYFDWDNMPNNSPTQAIQELLYNIGTTIGIDYSNGSGANYQQALFGFQTYGYKAEVKSHNSGNVIQELLNGRPIFMGGYSYSLSAAHAWICDGVRSQVYDKEYYVEYINSVNEYTNYGETSLINPHVYGTNATGATFHMNWGKGGEFNDWYRDNLTTPEVSFTDHRQDIYVCKQ